MPQGPKAEEDSPGEMAEDLLSEMEEDLPGEMAEDLPGEMAEDLPVETAEDLPGEMAEDLLVEISEDLPGDMEDLPESLEAVKIIEETEKATNAQIVIEYNLWKKETQFLYDIVISHALEWPSLTVEWLPDRADPAGQNQSVQKIVLGTHTCDDSPNYLMLAEVHMLCEDSISERFAKSKKVLSLCLWTVFFFVCG